MTVAARYEEGGEWSVFDEAVANVRGVVSQPFAGVSFKIMVQGTKASESSVIDSIGIRWQLSDKRGIRGMYNVIGVNS